MDEEGALACVQRCYCRQIVVAKFEVEDIHCARVLL